MKKVNLVLAIVLCVSLLLSIGAFAENVTIKGAVSKEDAGTHTEVETETTSVGEVLTVKIFLDNYSEASLVNNLQIKVALPAGVTYVADSAELLVSDKTSGGINYSAASNTVIFVWTDISSAIPAAEPDLFSFKVTVDEDATVGTEFAFAPVADVFENDSLTGGDTPVSNVVEQANVEVINTPTGDVLGIVIAVLMVSLACAVVLKRRVNA